MINVDYHLQEITASVRYIQKYNTHF